MEMKRIYNTETDTTLWRGETYLVDGQPATVEPPLVLLTEVERPDPVYEATTHRLERVAPYADLDAGEWVIRSTVAVSLTEDELAALARKTWPNAAAFLAEFTMPELAAVSLSTDPTVSALRLLLLAWPADVWSDDPRIVMGLTALVSAGIINETRKAEIIAK